METFCNLSFIFGVFPANRKGKLYFAVKNIIFSLSFDKKTQKKSNLFLFFTHINDDENFIKNEWAYKI